MVVANSLQNRAYQIILNQWGSSDEILHGETGSRERTFRWGHVLLLWGRRMSGSTFSFSLKLNLCHICVPQRFHIPLARWVDGRGNLFLGSKLCRVYGNLNQEWSVDIVMVILCKMILPICPSGPRIPQFTRRWIHSSFYNFFAVRESPGFCHINRAEAIHGWWLSQSVKDGVHLPPQIGSSPLMYQVSDHQH